MPRSSESVAALATALAKAQAELVNPEKSLTATIRTGRPGDGERSFRYAPLSSGLEIVRKTLGKHEIATVQTTAIDAAAGMVHLTTMLAHTSGEWIASDWPVCAVAETANPQRMGAALTYARRYALFTLVGIAGEDDLDAPDLNAANSDPGTSVALVPSGLAVKKHHSGNGRPAGGVARRPLVSVHQVILAAEESARLRDTMVTEIGNLASSSVATTWANGMLRVKNTLTAADARSVEAAFETKLASLPADLSDSAETALIPTALPSGSTGAAGHDVARHDAAECDASGQDAPAARDAIADGSSNDRSRPITKTVLHRNKEHLRFVRNQPCLVCARQPSDPHHLRFAQPRALGRKVSDEFTVPLCRVHHREVHRVGQETEWWQSVGIAPLAVAEALWRKGQSGNELNEPVSPSAKPAQRQNSRAANVTI